MGRERQVRQGLLRPLALCISTHDRKIEKRARRNAISGNVTINGTLLLVAQTNLPFGVVRFFLWPRHLQDQDILSSGSDVAAIRCRGDVADTLHDPLIWPAHQV